MDRIPKFSFDEPRLPISKWDYQIVTPMMEEILAVVSSEIERRAPGAAMYGTSRIGKTRALHYLLTEIRRIYPAVTVVHAIMVSRKRSSDTRFFKGLMSDFEFSMPLDGDGDDLRTAIVRQLLLRCSNAKDPRVLIVLDEAHRTTQDEFSYLIDLTNHMEKYGMSPTVILCAQPELLDRKSELIKARRRDVIGRFLEDPIQLSGVSSAIQLKAIMAQYDDSTVMQFPADSGTCITAAYAPHGYRTGLRISNFSEKLWEAVEEIACPIIKTPVIGMQTLTKTIESALVEFATQKDQKFTVDKSWWRNVLQEEGYTQHYLLTHDLESGA